jgi:ABC-type spermidine/putrescine transport system permease subunit II
MVELESSLAGFIVSIMVASGVLRRRFFGKHAMDQMISPSASLSHHYVAFSHLALHNDAWHHRKTIQPTALHKPRQRVVDGTRVREARVREM